ncbi:hypothetical protein [Candidatus Villigracilis saccharophilus]|uniref:hypothetical protein n=1 Tax=Candidatus Villigracilis saccharophilus TaxID=3140684 RepID=UPI003134B50A|nr:hypothetical protein [Anaerolineales bacterium]
MGFACYGPRDLIDGVFDLYWIAVDPEACRNQIGRGSLTASEEEICKLNGHILISETSGTPDSQLLFSMGYTIKASIKDFYTMGDDQMIFTKRL